MSRLSYTLLAGAMVLAVLLQESSCFTLHRFDNINDERREGSADAHPATSTGSGDEFSDPSQHQLFKRSAAAAAAAAVLPAQQHQLTAAEWQLLLQQMSDEPTVRPAAFTTTGAEPSSSRRQHLDWDASDELEFDDDDSWKNVDLLKKLFGNGWQSVKDMQFAHTSTEDLIEDWISRLAWGERQQHHPSSGSAL